ncbi:hypothetical protein DOY81_009284 [Sarcophaga bullata]|nr:hypothetical protein DOY81_009284 [Sarcophaga bullata]
MATKQELMNMMENRLPGEAVPVRDPTAQPPGYPDLDRVNYAAQQHMEQQNGPAPGPGHRQIYSIQPPQAIVVQPPQFGSRSHFAYCPSCNASQMTRCEYESSMMTHIVAAILCFTTCCCCLPYCIDNCKSARHYCPNCGSYLGAHAK